MRGRERFRLGGPDGLLGLARGLGLRLPFSDDVGALLQPANVGPLALPNRLAVHPMEGADAGPRGEPTELTRRRYVRFAAGGSGLLWFEAAAVSPEGRSNPRQLLLSRQNLDSWKRLTEDVRREAEASLGRDHRTALILQLTHSGRFARPDGTSKPVIARHHPLLDRLAGIETDHPLVSDAELDRLAEAHAAAARLAAAAGFDGVDVKACHGYLIGELLAARDRPASRYGGSYEDRTRWLKDTIRGIKAESPGLLVTSRLSAYDGPGAPAGFGCLASDEGRTEDLAEPVRLVQELAAAGVPLVSITVGIPALRPHIGRPFDVPVRGAALPEEHPLTGVARHIAITGQVQKAVPGLALLGAGYSWLKEFVPPVAAGALKEGSAALIGLGRGALAYPGWVRDLRDGGRLDPGRVCTACSRCSELLRRGGPAGCVIRDKKPYAAVYRDLCGPVRSAGRPAGRARRNPGGADRRSRDRTGVSRNETGKEPDRH